MPTNSPNTSTVDFSAVPIGGPAPLAPKAGDVHPHLPRHACGFKLVNQGVDTRTLAAYLGHGQIGRRVLTSYAPLGEVRN
jgi:integrase